MVKKKIKNNKKNQKQILIISATILIVGGIIGLIVYLTKSSPHSHKPGTSAPKTKHPSTKHPSTQCCIPQDWASVEGESGQNQKYWKAGGVDVCSCGQWSNYYLSKKYITPEGAEKGSFCKPLTNSMIQANTQAYWSNHGSNNNPLMICNSSDKNQNCCWWGRGAIQLTGQHNYYIFNKVLKKIYPEEKDLCMNPQQICPPVKAGEDYDDKLGWLAGIFFWENQIQTLFSSKYWNALNQFIKEDWTLPTTDLVANALDDINNWARCVSSVINLGFWQDNNNDPDGIESRLNAIYNLVKYFIKYINKFDDTTNLDKYLNQLDTNDVRIAAYPNLTLPDCRKQGQTNCPLRFKTQNLSSIINDYNSKMSNKFLFYDPNNTERNPKYAIAILAGFLGNISFETGYFTTCDETIWTSGPGDSAQAGQGTCYNPKTGKIDKCDEWQHAMCYYTGNSGPGKPRNEIHPFMCSGKDDLPYCESPQPF